MKNSRGRTLRWGLASCLGLSLATAVTCSRNFRSEVPDDDPAVAEGSQPPAVRDARRVTLEGITFVPHREWISETPTSSMRQGQYRLPRVDGDAEDGELVVFFFPGGGGGVQANIDRWSGQFTKPDGTPAAGDAATGAFEVNGLRITTLDVNGTYNQPRGPMMSETVAKPRYRMLAAVVEASQGPWFFRLTGPAETVASWSDSFDEFLRTVAPNG